MKMKVWGCVEQALFSLNLKLHSRYSEMAALQLATWDRGVHPGVAGNVRLTTWWLPALVSLLCNWNLDVKARSDLNEKGTLWK